jgi:hypothetical protein
LFGIRAEVGQKCNKIKLQDVENAQKLRWVLMKRLSVWWRAVEIEVMFDRLEVLRSVSKASGFA